jgi:hypothetical protein
MQARTSAFLELMLVMPVLPVILTKESNHE